MRNDRDLTDPNERLLYLADALDHHREQTSSDMTFNLHVWNQTNSCGTAACAVGLAGMLPAFNLLKFTTKDGWPEFPNPNSHHPDDDLLLSWDAVKEFFGISALEAYRLFDARAYSEVIGPEAEELVAGRIREFVNARRGST